MKLTIAIRIEVRDRDEGRRFFRVVKEQHANNPDVVVTGSISSDADEVEPADPG